MKVLITGGAVYGKLDDVKLITNKFKGGLIAKLADDLQDMSNDIEIIYVCCKDSKLPKNTNINIVYHDGFFDYEKIVLELAPQMDGVILGAAIANLIPSVPIIGKFPSHNYNVGDKVNIEFIITPRVIEKIKKIAPKTHLFGFKLLSNVSNSELINVAYDLVLESKATAVFANDTSNLRNKYAVTKERSVIPLTIEEYPKFIYESLNDEYFSTIVDIDNEICFEDINKIKVFTKVFTYYKDLYKERFKIVGNKGYIFGTIAVRIDDNNGFITTTRGKRELNEISIVTSVCNNTKTITVFNDKKASLNAPLLHKIFSDNQNINVIVHFHELDSDLITYDYAFPGTLRDSERLIRKSFNIDHHGCFYLFNKEGDLVK